MKIACLGWGSLIKHPGVLPVQGQWHKDGPKLALEFARKSGGDTGPSYVSLVIVPERPSTEVLWCLLDTIDLDVALAKLSEREGGMPSSRAGIWTKDGARSQNLQPSIEVWAQKRDIDAVIWTALKGNWAGKPDTYPAKAEQVLGYLKGLDPDSKKRAHAYIADVPEQIRTPFREYLVAHLGDLLPKQEEQNPQKASEEGLGPGPAGDGGAGMMNTTEAASFQPALDLAGSAEKRALRKGTAMTVSPAENLEKLQNLLEELFQLDQADFDFGIYRIMNARREEITRFLKNDLLPQVREVLGSLETAGQAQVKADLEKAEGQARELGMDPGQSPKVQELKARYAAAQDLSATENEVLSDLYAFFRRYYSEGDFLSLRRYKEGVYAIPYEGEEVKLHWANVDQYYIKTSEYLRDFAFKLEDGRRVHFKLVEAETEKDNRKAAPGKERRFVLSGEKPVHEESGELIIPFEYRPADGAVPETEREEGDGEPKPARGKKVKQETLNAQAVEAILKSPAAAGWAKALSAPVRNKEGEVTGTLLAKRLKEYTARNTFDYFIHKDLGGFLRRELDFFIKNEIVHLDDIENESAPRVEAVLSKVKAIRKIAHKIIDFLAQLENFQKKLWLKKKFVVETQWCVTLDRVPEALYPEIAANQAQWEEWEELYAISEIPGNLFQKKGAKGTKEEKAAFLKANPYLVLDTRHYEKEFKDRLVASWEDVDQQTDGVVIQSENFQALSLLAPRLQASIDSMYLDPPYNTGTEASDFVYKNTYQHSSWISFIENRIRRAIPLLEEEGVICITIDDYEYAFLSVLCELLPNFDILGTAVIRNKPQGRPTASGFSVNHEYAIFLGRKGSAAPGRLPREGRKAARYPEHDETGYFAWANLRKTGAGSRRVDRPKQFYPLFVEGDAIRIPNMEWLEGPREWNVLEKPGESEIVVFPIDDEGTERVWNLSADRVLSDLGDLRVLRQETCVQIQRKYRPNTDGALPDTWWDNKLYSASESGTKLLQNILGKDAVFPFPKSVYAVRDCLRASNGRGNEKALVLDFFAGSGTTAHAVINLNREDGGCRKYILVEMGDYFDTVLVPRIKKVVYSKDWKDGKPVSREGISHCFKVLRLESYEDTLNNLVWRERTPVQQNLLEGSRKLREDYTLRYLLDVETKGSDSLLNLDRFEDPFSYALQIATGSVSETKPVTLDLIETFNYLIGLRVKHRDTIRGVTVVQGTNPAGEKVLILWRNVKQTPNDALEAFFRKQGYNSKDQEFGLIYVNGDNTLENLKRPDDTWKVRLIEQEFLALMFDTKEA